MKIKLPLNMKELTKFNMLIALMESDGNRAKAAGLIGMSERTFYRWMKVLKIERVGDFF